MDKEVVSEYIEFYVAVSEICAHFSVNTLKEQHHFFAPEIHN